MTEASLRAADAAAVPDAITAAVRAVARDVGPGDGARPVDHRGIGHDVRQGPCHRIVDGCEHEVFAERARLALPGTSSTTSCSRAGSGWCEQIASSLVVLARSVGIPARLVTGFAPGARDALTGRFVVREKDAHAWAEIYFAGIGWQGFDPTAAVPLAGDAGSGGSWLSSARHNAVPLAIVAVLLVLIAAATPEIMAAVRRRRARRASWSADALHRLERAGRKAGRARAPAETPRQYAHALAEQLGDERVGEVGDTLDRDLYSAHGASPAERADADAVLTSLRP